MLFVAALFLLYMTTILSFFAPLSVVGEAHSLSKLELRFAVLLNALEALAVFVVYRSTDAPHAVVFAGFLWALEAFFAFEALTHVDHDVQYSRRRAVAIMITSALSFGAVSMLAFG